VPGVVLLGAATITARSALALATGSTFLYFLPPMLGTPLVATAFLASVLTGRPLAARPSRPSYPLPDRVASAPVDRRAASAHS